VKTESTLKSTSSITPEQIRDVRARAWAFIFSCHERKKAAAPSRPDDDVKESDGYVATNHHSK
jgi:hypothetical protein